MEAKKKVSKEKKVQKRNGGGLFSKTNILMVISAILTLLVVRRLHAGHAFRDIQPHHSFATCTKLPGPPGIENLDINRKTGMAFLAASDKHLIIKELNDTKGEAGIYILDLNKDGSKIEKIPIVGFPAGQPFMPHGMKLRVKENGETFVYVVNHRQGAKLEFVEIFQYKDNKLYHKQSITDPLFFHLNDVVPVDDDSFYVTNDHAEKQIWKMFLSDFADICTGNVVYYGKSGASIALDGLCFANGINKNHDGSLYFVAESTTDRLSVCKPLANHSLEVTKSIQTDIALDNIDVVGNQLYLGGHPNQLKFITHSWFGWPSPSAVLRVTLGKGQEQDRIDEIFMSKGEDLSGVSIAAYHKGKMLLGAVFEEGLLVCKEK